MSNMNPLEVALGNMSYKDLTNMVIAAALDAGVPSHQLRANLVSRLDALAISVEHKEEIIASGKALKRAIKAVYRAEDYFAGMDSMLANEATNAIEIAYDRLEELRSNAPKLLTDIKRKNQERVDLLARSLKEGVLNSEPLAKLSEAIRFPIARKEGKRHREEIARKEARARGIRFLKASYSKHVLDCACCDERVQENCIAVGQCDVLDPFLDWEPQGNPDAVRERQ